MEIERKIFRLNQYKYFNIKGKNTIYTLILGVSYRPTYSHAFITRLIDENNKSLFDFIDFIYNEGIDTFCITVDKTFKEKFEKEILINLFIPKEIIDDSDIIIIYVFDLSYLSCFNSVYRPKDVLINPISLS
jgi:hypothetical protein